MKIFAISDLHLPGTSIKPMDVFGVQWDRHQDKIQENWNKIVSQEDLVLIPGDISWAMTLADARGDLDFIGELPGRKIILRGNHDYWWSSVSRIRQIVHPSIEALQNNAFKIGNVVICGTRGWLCPGRDSTAEDEKIYNRECIRLKLSLDAAMPLCTGGEELIVMLHYPPRVEGIGERDFIHILEQYPVNQVIYGHVHGPKFSAVFAGLHDRTQYNLVSCDYIDFSPMLIYDEKK